MSMLIRLGAMFALILMLAAAAPADNAAPANNTAPAAPASADAAADGALKARATLDKMGKFYAALDQAEVKISLSVIADVHAKPEIFGNTFVYAVKRPNLYYRELRNAKEADKIVSLITSSGENMTYYHGDYNLYAVLPQPLVFTQMMNVEDPPLPGTLDIMTLFAYLIQPDPADAIMKNATGLTHAGTESVNSAELEKLELRLNGAPTELWIAQGDKPHLVQARVDVSNQIPMRNLPPNTPLKALIEYSGWKTADVDAARFAFAPPAGAEKRDTPEDIMKEGILRDVAEEARTHELVGKPAPDFTLARHAGGDSQKLADLKGKNVVVLDFWATWCGPCVISMPMMIEVTNEYKDKGVLFLAVNQQQEKDVIEQFLKQRKIAPDVLLDTDGKVSTQYGASSIPFTVFVGKDGLVKRVHQGTLRDQALARRLLKMEIEDVLAGK